MVETLHFFTTRGWQFKSERMMELWNSLSAADKQVNGGERRDNEQRDDFAFLYFQF